MKKINKVFLFFSLATSYLLLATNSYAVCPVCTIAVGAGLGLSRYLGIDDTITGLWVGGLILSSAFWAADWLHNKKVGIKLSVLNGAMSVLFFFVTIIPLYFTDIIGHPYNQVYGLDKLVFGTLFGMVIFLLALALDKQVRKINGRQLFVYQKVVFPVTSLAIISLIMYFGIK